MIISKASNVSSGTCLSVFLILDIIEYQIIKF